MAEILTEAMTMKETIHLAMKLSLEEFVVVLHTTANGAEDKAKGTKSPGIELYWGGYVDGLRDAAQIAELAASKL
jgi:hypothetical protein